jgi:ABC-2 type transport system permease protein
MSPVDTPDGAQIAARGFQRYEGERSGVPGAIRSVTWQAMRSTLGLGRPAKNKIFPVISVAIAYVPAIVFIGLAVLIPSGIVDGPTYPEYYGFITSAIVLPLWRTARLSCRKRVPPQASQGT